MHWTREQVAEHNTPGSCWVIINSKVYDVTDFLPQHPGGSSIILKYAGKDATAVYAPIHPPDAIDKALGQEKHMGELYTTAAMAGAGEAEKTKDQLRVERAQREKPPLSRILNLKDMEDVARKVLSYKALAYYASAADDEITKVQNSLGFSRFFFHPRILRPLSTLNTCTTMLAAPISLPIFISPAALARLGHPMGEINLTRGAHRTGIIQIVSSNASFSYAAIAESRPDPAQVLWFQLYKHKDKTVAEARVKEVVDLGYKAICLTVDALVPGNREMDVRAPWVLDDIEGVGGEGAEVAAEPEIDEDGANLLGTAGALIGNDDRDMTWEETIPWLRGLTDLPIVLKGIQSVADAVLAAEAGVDGIIISNHGGRSLEYSMPSIEVLYRIRKERPDVFERMEVYIDGGVSRGTDVLKALCLGAKAVGLGRPFLYALSAYGEAGVVKIIRILEREILTGMRLLGARTIDDLVPQMVEKVDWEPFRARL